MLWLILSVLIWAVVHTLLASLGVKEWFRNLSNGNRAMSYYRFGYNLFSGLSFLPILWLLSILPDKIIYRISAPWLYLFLAGQGFAALLLLIGLLQTDVLAFVGVRQLFKGEERPSKLVTNGLYRYVRHPLYSAGLLFIWLAPVMSMNSLILFTSLTIYILVGVFFEERKLSREFGQEYVDYRAVTPMLIPGLNLKRNK